MTDTKAFDAERARVAKLEAENAKMREQLKTERRAGIEEAAQMARAHGAAQVHATFGPEATLQDALMIGYRLCGDAIERDIRALADKPAQKGDDNG